MIQLHPPTLDSRAGKQLRAWTTDLTREADFDERVKAAKKRFKSRNTKTNKTFQRVKTALYMMCNATWRCVYCEDNFADEVEHMRPKDIYPDECFAWKNYVYACGPCNGPKNNHFAVVDAQGVEHVVTPPRPPRGVPAPPRIPPIAGQHLFVDPRVEDPMYFLALDLDSGAFAPHPQRNTSEQRRGEWMKDTIGLNKRRLPKARRLAFGTFRSRLKEYADERDEGANAARLGVLKTELLELDHQTVLREMKRQRGHYPEVDALFTRVPEALTWF